jgi:hypothetical protein
VKVMDGEKKELQRKLKLLEGRKDGQEKDLKVVSHKASKILTDPSTYESQTHAYKIFDRNRKNDRMKK